MPAKIPPITPAILYRCYRIKAPDDPQWKAMITGALKLLTFGYYWERGAQWEAAKAEGQKIVLSWENQNDCVSDDLCQTLVDTLNSSSDYEGWIVAFLVAVLQSCGTLLQEKLEDLASLPSIFFQQFGANPTIAESASVMAEWGVEMELPQYRLNGCAFEVSYDGGETWIPQFEFDLESCPALQGAPGEDGEDGAPGPQGDTGEKGDTGATGPAGAGAATVSAAIPETDAHICAGAQAVLDWCAMICDVVLAKIDLETLALQIVADVVGASVIGDWVVDDVLSAIANAQAATTIVINAAHTPQVDLDLKCEIYCFLRDYETVDGAAIRALAESTHVLGNAWKVFFWSVFYSNAGQEFVAAFASGASNTDNSCAVDCTACPSEWCKYVDLTVSNGGFTLRPDAQYGQWVSGVGWRGTAAGSGKALYLRLATEGADLLDIQFDWSNTSCDGTSGGSLSEVSGPTLLNWTMTNGLGTRHWTGDNLTGTLALGQSSGGGSSPVMVISRFQISGSGAIPTVLQSWNDCP